MCLYPRLLKNKKYTKNNKNGGKIPAVSDERTLLVPVKCGNCLECMKAKSREWQIRLQEDIRHNKNGIFITLTFSDESYYKLAEEFYGIYGYLLDNQICKLAVRRFLERWRKKYKKSIRHWLITEIGHNGTKNVHMHGILWTDKVTEIEKIWQYGYVWTGNVKNGIRENYVNERTINYITKYITKKDLVNREYKPVILTSAGIGSGYMKRLDSKRNVFKGEKTKETYTTKSGHEVSLPIYWRNKIYTEEEREKLWIEKLNKETRYVMGEKVNISKGTEEYEKLLKYHQKRNEELGYKTIEGDEQRKLYERNQRMLQQITRIKKGKAKLEKKSRK